jgi:flagellar protein FliO/FliZ
MAGSVAQMLFGLVIVIAALFGVLAMLRKLQGGRTHLVGGLKVIGATSVGPRERVVLVALGSKVLVLGVTPGRVNALHTLEATELPQAPEQISPVPGDFASRLRQLLEKHHAN